MAMMKKYTNISLNGVAGPQTLAGASAAVVSNGVPIYGARMIVFRIKSTNAILPNATAINIGNDAARTKIFGSITSVGYASAVTNIGIACNGGSGNVISAAANSNQGRFHHNFAQFSMTPNTGASPTNDMTGVTVDAEVWYDGDADAVAIEAGQQNYVMLTT